MDQRAGRAQAGRREAGMSAGVPPEQPDAMQQRAAKIIAEVRAARRGWKSGQIWKGKAGPRCRALTKNGTPCPHPMYVNGFCKRHGGGLIMDKLRDRIR